MKQVFRCFLYVFSALFISACAGLKTVTVAEWPSEKAELTDTLAELYRDVLRTSESIRAVEGYADIWLKTPKRKERLYSAVQLHRSEDMRLIVSTAIVGWPVADILFRPDTLFVHDMVNNRLLVGNNSPENIEKILGLHAGYGFLSDVLAGVYAAAEPQQAIEEVRTGYGKIRYTVRAADGKRDILVDPLKKIVEGIRFIDSAGRIRAEVYFREHMSYVLDGVALDLPRRIEVLMVDPVYANRKRELVIAYDERVYNPPGLDINYSVPKKARVIELDNVTLPPWM